MSEKTQNAFQKYIIPAILAVALIRSHALGGAAEGAG